MKKIFACILMLLTAFALFAQKEESKKERVLVIFPFTGGNNEDGEALASSLTRQRALLKSFSKIIPMTRDSEQARKFEESFQFSSGMTNEENIVELGKALNASHVMAGYITKFKDKNIVLVSIMDVESLQQIAGDHRTYKSIEEIDKYIPDIAKKLDHYSSRDTISKLPGLAVPPFTIKNGVDKEDAMVLAQILACELANGDKYAVLPRTQDNLDKVKKEQARQMGNTDEKKTIPVGAGRNPEYVLSGSVQRLGKLNKFGVDILDIKEGSLYGEEGYERNYGDLSDGLELIPKLANEINRIGPADFIRIKGGSFKMGGNKGEANEKPEHSVTIKSFWMSKYTVTQKEWKDVMGITLKQQMDKAQKDLDKMQKEPTKWQRILSFFGKKQNSSMKLSLPGEGDRYPMYYVNWREAVDYCNQRSKNEKLTPVYQISGDKIACNWDANGYRLPSEAEWEFAAKGANMDHKTSEYSGSDSENDVWHEKNSGNKVHSVGEKKSNSPGLFDMSGNIWEWCWDFYGAYQSGEQTDPRGPSTGSDRIIRGGSWNKPAESARSVYRGSVDPSIRSNTIGFRLVRRRV